MSEWTIVSENNKNEWEYIPHEDGPSAEDRFGRVWIKGELTAVLSIQHDRRHLIIRCPSRWPTMFEAMSAVEFLVAPEVTMTMLLPKTNELKQRKESYEIELWETHDPMIRGR